MTELEKIEYAKMFLDKLANGINPLDNTLLKEEDVVNHERLSRCFFYVSSLLQQLIDQGGFAPKKEPKIRKSLPFSLTPEQRALFEYSEEPLYVSDIAQRLNDLKDEATMKNIQAKDITNWLLQADLLEVWEDPDGATTRLPSSAGKELGILSELRTNARGEYRAILYNISAQQFILDNLDAILTMKAQK